MDRVLGLVKRVKQGLGAVGFIEGEAGIGKTSLLEGALAAVVPHDYRVLRGAANELESDRPFGALAQALEIHPDSTDAERIGIARLLLGETIEDPVKASGSGEVRFRLVEAIVSLAERLALTGPVLLALEDLHWADASTLLTVHHIGRRLTHLPFVLLATFRPSPRSTVLDRVVTDLADGGGLHLVLGPLDDSAVVTLVEWVAQAPPAPRLLAAAGQATGNPLFVKELVRALKADGRLLVTDGWADIDSRVIPYSFRSLVLRQLATLPERTRHVLRVAAVLGTSFSLTELAATLGRPPTDLLDPLDEAFRAKILGDAGDCMAFRHELVREAVYLDLPTAVRRGLHLQVGWMLAARGASAVQVAPHLVRGAAAGDDSAVEWLWRAAAQVAPRLPGAAVKLFEHALQLTQASDSRQYAITAELVDALVWSGRYPEAAARTHELLERDRDTRRRNAVRLSLMRAMLIAGRIEDANAEVDAALRDFSGNERDRLHLDINAALARVFSGDPVGARVSAQDAVERARRLDEDEIRQYAYSVICIASLLAGETPHAVAAGSRALDLGGPSASAAHRHGAHVFLGTALMEVDRLDEGDRVLRDGQRIAEEVGMASLPAFYHAQIGLHRFDIGRWDDAVAELEAASLVAMEQTGAPATFAEAILAIIEVRRGWVTRAAEHVATAQRAVAEGHGLSADAVMWAAAVVQEAQGDSHTALAMLENAWQLNHTMGFRSQNIRIGPDLVRLALAAGQRELATAVAAELAELAELNCAPSRTGVALLCRGLAETDLEPIRAAVRAYRESPRVAERAWVFLLAGLAFAEAGQRDEAIALLTEAIAESERFGAARDIARAEAALRTLGTRRGRRGPRGRALIGWDSLTRSELDIVRLAVEGLTNAQIGERLFISGRTVETHFSHVFTKLGVSSRVQVAAEAARRLGTDGLPRPGTGQTSR